MPCSKPHIADVVRVQAGVTAQTLNCPLPHAGIVAQHTVAAVCIAPSSVVLLPKVTDVEKDSFRSHLCILKLSCSISVTFCNKNQKRVPRTVRSIRQSRKGSDVTLQDHENNKPRLAAVGVRVPHLV